MKTKREYEEAFDLINIFTSCGCNDVGDCNCCIAYNKRLKQQHGCELDLALNMFKELIEEHFKLKEKYSKILDDVHDYRYETHCMKMTIRNLCEHFGVKNEAELKNIYLNKPYKFEDLKPNMWVWDNVAKECLYVVRPFITTGVRVKYFTCLGIWNLEKIKKLNILFLSVAQKTFLSYNNECVNDVLELKALWRQRVFFF